MVASKPKPLGNKKKPDELKKTQKPDELWKTVCCCLCADESTRKFLWEAMERYTLLVNLLSKQVGHAPEFEQWKRQGWVSEKAVVTLCDALKQEEQFKGLPSRFYMSAQSMVKDTFEGWVKSQQRLSRRISGKKRWLKLVEEDIELAKTTDFSSEVIQNRAKEILFELNQQETPAPQSSEGLTDDLDDSQQEDEGSNSQRSLFSLLFDVYGAVEDYLSRRAIVHLLKSGGEVNEEMEDPEKLAQRLATKREEIQRLEAQLASRLPKGRDPTGEQAKNFLQEAIQRPEHPKCYPELFLFNIFYHYASLPMPSVQYAVYLLQTILIESKVVESEFLAWQEAMTERLTNVAKITNFLLYPLIFGSTDDLYWSFESKEKNQHDSELGKPCERTKSKNVHQNARESSLKRDRKNESMYVSRDWVITTSKLPAIAVNYKYSNYSLGIG